MDATQIILAVINVIGLVVVAFFQMKGSKESAKTDKKIDNMTSRNQAISNIRTAQEQARDDIDDAFVELMTEYIWAMKRQSGVGNGELEHKLEHLMNTRTSAKKAVRDAQDKLKNL